MTGKKRAERVQRVQELRRSSAATPIPSRRRYRRRAKHTTRGDES